MVWGLQAQATQLTVQELAKRKVQRRAAIRSGRNDLLTFVRLTHPRYEVGWFHRELAAVLEWFAAESYAGNEPRLIISAPPRHGKSAIVSERFPVWASGRYPGAQIVCASYAQDLADRNSRTARTTSRGEEAEEVFPGLRPIKQEKRHATDYRPNNIDRVSHWQDGLGGSYKAVGVGGPLTGHGCHMLLIDDPVKDAAAAGSATVRQGIWDWYATTALTRVAPGGGVLIMMTRWHEDDLVGRVVAREGRVGEKRKNVHGDIVDGRWREFRFPAIAEQDEKHRARGEALHEARWPLDSLKGKREVLSPSQWAALYQQRPRPATGGTFQEGWFKRYTEAPEDVAGRADEVWGTCDANKKGTPLADLTSIQIWARCGRDYYLLDRLAGRWALPVFLRRLGDMNAKWQVFLDGWLIEDHANGTSALQYDESRDDEFELVNATSFDPRRDTPGKDKSKPARAAYMVRPAEAGHVHLPDGAANPRLASAVVDWLDTVKSFPAGTHDDDVDAASQLIMRWELARKRGTEMPTVAVPW